MFSRWDNFNLPDCEDNDYGYETLVPLNQCARELVMFDQARRKKNQEAGFKHCINIVRLLFPFIDIYKDVPKGRVWNNYFLDIIHELCSFNDVIITGPASANKTYTTSCFGLINFISAPSNTLVMVSTTSSTSSERKIWADIKELHRSAKWEECGFTHNGEPTKIGEVTDHLKVITFDSGKQLYGSKKNDRDYRNAIQVIPIARDSTGDNALASIQGSKNTNVLWILDEMANMNEGITRPNANLRANPHYQFIGLGNAGEPTDPHAREALPPGGLDALDVNKDRRWTSSTGKRVLFLHADDSPNNNPIVPHTEEVRELPFPYCSNKIITNITALEFGHGDIEEGKKTIDYWKFCIGFWAPSDASSTLFSSSLIRSYGAEKKPDVIFSNERNFGAGDFAFTAGGDDNVFMHAKFGLTQSGEKRLIFDSEAISIKPKAEGKDFIDLTADEFAKHITLNKIRPSDFGGDTGNDASVTLNSISKKLQTYNLVGISSSGSAYNKKYKNRVSELWFMARVLIKTGLCRGFNINSKYADELFKRRYKAVGKGEAEIERKKDMKKRIGRSPDHADAFIYLCWMVCKSGLFDEEIQNVLALEEDNKSHSNISESSDDYDSAFINELFSNDSQKEEEFLHVDILDDYEEFQSIDA